MSNPPALPRTMRAIICHGPRDYRLEEIAVPVPGPGEVLAKIHFAGISASDLKCFLGAPMFWGTPEKPGGYCEPPITAGHEFIAQVVQLGEGSAQKYGLALGDHVISEQIVPCQDCRFCRDGQHWMCDINDVYGFRQNTPGAWADYMLFPQKALNYKVPKTLRLDHAAFIEPLACSVHAVEQGNIKPGDTVAIAGCGPLGLGMVAAAKMKNPKCIIAIDLHEKRLANALRSGADLAINPKTIDVVAKVRELTGGYGCDVYIEATGSPAGVGQGLEMIRKLGTFVEFSVFTEPVSVDWTIIGDRKELTIRGAHLSPNCYPIAMQMLGDGLLPMDEIITHKLALGDYERGIDLVRTATGSSKKVIFDMSL